MGANLADLFTQRNTEYNSVFTLAALPNVNLVESDPEIAYAGNVTNSIGGVRGQITIDASSVITSGWLEAVAGRFVLKGTLNNTHSEYCAALLGQLDVSAATALTSGALSMLWLDAGGSSVNSTILNAVQGITITNSTGSALQAVLWIDAAAA